MDSSVTSYVANDVPKSVEDFSHTVGNTIPGLAVPRCSDEEYKRLLKHREKLRAKHIKMEAERQAMRRKMLAKYRIKESERHKNKFKMDDLSNDEIALLNESNHTIKDSCFTCILCCFKKK